MQTEIESKEAQNPLCPDWYSHYNNAADLLVPEEDRQADGTVTQEQDEAIRAHADREFAACEGH